MGLGQPRFPFYDGETEGEDGEAAVVILAGGRRQEAPGAWTGQGWREEMPRRERPFKDACSHLVP